MEREKIKHLLNQVGSLLKSYDKIAKATGENFNIFTVMGMESNEVKTHSAIIGELLNLKGSHGLGDKPLKLFIEQIKLEINKNQSNLEKHSLVSAINDDELNKIFNLNTTFSKSTIEESIGKINENITEGGRVDILVFDNENKAFVIENKIYAGEQINQLGRYNKAFPKAPILYLTLFGDKPNSAGDLIENEDYFIVSYKESILNWLEECLKEAVKYPMLREVICQYINLIKKLTHQTINHELKKEIMDLIKNNFLEALEISKNYNTAKNEVIKVFWDKLEQSVREKLVEGNWVVKQDLKLISKYNHLLFSNKENDKAYLYYRFNINDGTIEYGIILKEGKGSDVYKTINESKPGLIPKIFKTSDYQSVIWKKDEEYDFSDPEQLTKIFKEEKTNSNKTLEKLTNKVEEFIENNKEIYDKILENLILKTN